MIKTRIFLILISGFLLSGISALIAYFYDPLKILFFIIAMLFLMISLIMAQLTYAFYSMKKDAYEKAMDMKLCPYCQKPVKRNDKVCPHCHKNL